MNVFLQTVNSITGSDYAAGVKAQERLDSLTKPPASLGVLEKIAVQLACIQGQSLPVLGPKVVMVMAGDHGVVAEGVSAYPKEVTPQMVLNFLNQGAAINVLSRHAGAKVVITDVGVAAEMEAHPDLNLRKVRAGTRNMALEAAMTEEETMAALEIGMEMAHREIDRGAAILATGEMGIGNTTPSSAILACYSDNNLASIIGRGTGLNDGGLKIKQEAIQKALQVNQPDAQNPLDVLQKVGGLEIAALTGVILASAARKTPVVIDGFISTAAALLAWKIHEKCRDYILASHLSQEPGHKVMLDLMGLQPMLRLDLRLGEGTGGVLAFSLIEAAVKIIHEMATFAEAGVTNKE